MTQIVHNHQIHKIQHEMRDRNITQAPDQFRDAMRTAQSKVVNEVQVVDVVNPTKLEALSSNHSSSPRFSPLSMRVLERDISSSTNVEHIDDARLENNITVNKSHLHLPVASDVKVVGDSREIIHQLEPIPENEDDVFASDAVLLRGKSVSFAKIRKEMLTRQEQDAYDASIAFAEFFIDMMLDIVFSKDKEMAALCGGSEDARYSRSVARLNLVETPGSILNHEVSTCIAKDVAPLFFESLLEVANPKPRRDIEMS
ncbi:hypothetical protein Sarmat_00724 [Rickettsiales endosymbiont of Paramecium tredecaurelia]|uniref:hypothetical protein n=1 Tax=Candidatus Sarmatiella mevalonica TaxID=2770581 RepID=UPI001921525E|nr:hypothetical protein [Candidatus Sarmatiella mevalonica]MBL3284866.1 hypothetical protein [Candidatus Sarmatiella mevalonica]